MKVRKLTSKPEEVQRKDIKGLKLTDLDRQNIAYTINFFERAFPGVIRDVTARGRKETIPLTDVELRKAMGTPLGIRRIAIPSGLWGVIKEQYPAIQVDRRQFEQFLKWFPIFDLLRR
jgi:hypothetical protein